MCVDFPGLGRQSLEGGGDGCFRVTDFDEAFSPCSPLKRVPAGEAEVNESEGVGEQIVFGVGDEDDVTFCVFVRHEPRSAAQSESFSLTDGVKPVTLVCAHLLSCFLFNDRSLLLAEVAPHVVTPSRSSEEAESLAVATVCRGQVLFVGDGSDLRFVEMSDGEDRLAELRRSESGEEVCLVLDRVGRGE